MNSQFRAKTLCAFLAVLAAAALVLMFEAAPSAQARTTAIPRGARAANNAGSNSGCPATDQRGIVRPRTTQNPCDIGAYEGTYVFLPLIEK